MGRIPAVTHREIRGAVLPCRDEGSESNNFPPKEKGRVCKDLSPGSTSASSSGTGRLLLPSELLAPSEVRGAGPCRPPVQVSLPPAPLRAHATEPPAGAESVKGGQPEGLIFGCETWLSAPSPLPTLHTLRESDTCGFGPETQLY